MFDLNLLLVFEAMFLHRNVTSAATTVGLTQSAMSGALARLRRQFDDPLFVNTRGAMLPTVRALELAKPFRQALILVRASTTERDGFDPRESTRTFRFQMTDVAEMVFLPRLVKRLDEMEATVKVETTQLMAAEVGERLESGDIDFATAYLPSLPQSFERTPLFREHYVCMTRRSYTGGRPLTLEKFLAGSHVLIESLGSGHRIIERTLKQRGLKRDVSLRVPHFVVVPMIVAGTDRIVTAPSRVADAFSALVNVEVHRLPIRIPSFDVSLSCHTRFAEDPALRWMRNTMIDLFREPLAGKRSTPNRPTRR
jgi:DNA-binding transcriptional LysR family regulator